MSNTPSSLMKKQKKEVNVAEPMVIDLTMEGEDEVSHEPIVEGQRVWAKQTKNCKHSHPAVVLSINGPDAKIKWLNTNVIEDVELEIITPMELGGRRKRRQTSRLLAIM